MKKTATTQVIQKSGKSRPQGQTDWTKLAAMKDDEVMAAAQADTDSQPLDAQALGGMKRVSRVKALRQRLGLTQAEFAEAYAIPVGTLRDWEQRRSIPDAPARALLHAIERDPKTMRRLLQRVA
jgi:putative transcriptional regulator